MGDDCRELRVNMAVKPSGLNNLLYKKCIFPNSTIFLVAVVVFDLDCSFWDCCSLQSSYKFLSKDKFFEIGLYRDSIFQISGLMRVTKL